MNHVAQSGAIDTRPCRALPGQPPHRPAGRGQQRGEHVHHSHRDGLTEALSGDPAGLVDAVGLPTAADTALLTPLGGFEISAVATNAVSVVGDLAGLIP
ncbi:hypothetical protein ACOJVU_10095 [Mycobacterium sp. THU-M104]|uniref:hypothetical protein n=1 Tax=Mycobacterium sp. THU-M104 TaxID=3410515 RepID=UPI003B9BF09B